MFVTANISSLIEGPKWGLSDIYNWHCFKLYSELWPYLLSVVTEIPVNLFLKIYMMLLRSVHPIAFLFTATSQTSSAPISPQTYTANAEAAIDKLQTWYNSTTGIYDTTGWWNSANCLTVLGDFAALDPSFKDTASGVFANSIVQAQNYNVQITKVVQPNFSIETLYGSFQPPGIISALISNTTKGFLNGYYDDEGWWALAWIQAYDVTGTSEYLQTAVSIFEDMKNGSTTNCQGGIWWDKAHTYVNAIANELYLSVASHLSNRMSNKQYYLNIALDQLAWFQHSGMINPENLINDGLTATCTNNNGTEWSYNQGVILGGLVELNNASPNRTYLTTATSIAKATIKSLSDSNGVLHDPCEPDCGADGSQFKGIFMRNLQILQQAAPDQSFLSFIAANADSIWAANRNSVNELSVVWSGPFQSPANASTQSSALDALVAAAAFEGNGISS